MILLIVDDEPIIREGIRSLIDFDSLGITRLLEAENGLSALEIFKNNLPDIVLADINMPKMNGLDFSKEIKAIKPDVKIALITGYDYFDYARQAIQIGVEDYILKPVSKKDITKLLRSLCDKVIEDKGQRQVDEIVDKMSDQNHDPSDLSYKSQINKVLDSDIYNMDLSLTLVADKLGISTGYLSGIFKKIFGASFKEYVLTKRLEQAKLLLLSTQMKNYEIGEAIGFSDANYFSTAFKKHVGMSPKQYKEDTRK